MHGTTEFRKTPLFDTTYSRFSYLIPLYPCAYSIYVNIHFYKFNCNSRFYYSQINVDKDEFRLTTKVIVDNFILKKQIIN